jgi:hypothetical protein
VPVNSAIRGDASALKLPRHFLTQLGLPDGATYATAMKEINVNGTTRKAGKFTAAVLALRHDERVQGRELPD